MNSLSSCLDRPPQAKAQKESFRRFVSARSRRALWLVLAGALVLLLLGSKPAAKGLALGGLFSVVNFQILARTLGPRLAREGWSGRVFGLVWIVLRMAVLALPLLLAAKTDFFSLAATAAGLLAIQAVIMVEPLISRLKRR
ncbi:MAG: ATP synthase subunit I [Deltaproteobacteria bacterium]|nr:ATP synthase subunit I [Deltaproteobacteria bacterium]